MIQAKGHKYKSYLNPRNIDLAMTLTYAYDFLLFDKYDADSSIHIHNSPVLSFSNVKNFLPKWMDEDSAGERSIWLRMSSSLFRSSGLNKSSVWRC